MINGETLLYCLQFATFVRLLLSPKNDFGYRYADEHFEKDRTTDY